MNELVKKENAELAVVTPMEMIQQAVMSGATVETMKALMDLQERWEKNEARKAYVVAMADFKKEAPQLIKNKTVSFGKTEYDHASLDMVVNTIQPILDKHGFTHRWKTSNEGGVVAVTCVITHNLGHSEETTLQSGADGSGGKNNIQAIGSAVTYLQRYTLLSALGLVVSGQDNDAINACAVISEEQFNEISALLDDTNSDKIKFCQHFCINSVADLSASDFKAAITMVRAKVKK